MARLLLLSKGPDSTTPVSRVIRRKQKLEYPREMENRNSIENRSRDMLELEEFVRREAQEAKAGGHVYRIELKNRGDTIIKWIFLVAVYSVPDNPSHRQFACMVKVQT